MFAMTHINIHSTSEQVARWLDQLAQTLQLPDREKAKLDSLRQRPGSYLFFLSKEGFQTTFDDPLLGDVVFNAFRAQLPTTTNASGQPTQGSKVTIVDPDGRQMVIPVNEHGEISVSELNRHIKFNSILYKRYYRDKWTVLSPGYLRNNPTEAAYAFSQDLIYSFDPPVLERAFIQVIGVAWHFAVFYIVTVLPVLLSVFYTLPLLDLDEKEGRSGSIVHNLVTNATASKVTDPLSQKPRFKASYMVAAFVASYFVLMGLMVALLAGVNWLIQRSHSSPAPTNVKRSNTNVKPSTSNTDNSTASFEMRELQNSKRTPGMPVIAPNVTGYKRF